ncbi:MAG: DUF6607 family protein [Bacteroidota bacterium]
MKKVIFGLALAFCFSSTVMAQVAKKMQDRKAILGMCGCYEVDFNFAETFNYSKDENYKPSEVKHSGGLEWAQLVEDEDNKIVIQHILVAGSPEEPYIIKHWRQDWVYENTDFYMFNHDRKWTFERKPKAEVVGQWTQKVFQVDDSPRYEGTGSWVHVDGKSYWESTTDAPLPRREYTKRADYNVTIRRNRQEITDKGWIHDQDNDKVVRKDGEEDFVLAQEKGMNYYNKVDDSKCKAAADWWQQHHGKWATVRQNWDAVFAKNQDLELAKKVEGKLLYKYLFDDSLTDKNKIKKVIDDFVLTAEME